MTRNVWNTNGRPLPVPGTSGTGREPAAVRLQVLLGVVVCLEDLDQAVEGSVCAVAFGAEHHNIAV